MPIHIETQFPPDDTTHVISLGAGVQSTVVYLMAALGQMEGQSGCANPTK